MKTVTTVLPFADSSDGIAARFDSTSSVGLEAPLRMPVSVRILPIIQPLVEGSPREESRAGLDTSSSAHGNDLQVGFGLFATDRLGTASCFHRVQANIQAFFSPLVSSPTGLKLFSRHCQSSLQHLTQIPPTRHGGQHGEVLLNGCTNA